MGLKNINRTFAKKMLKWSHINSFAVSERNTQYSNIAIFFAMEEQIFLRMNNTLFHKGGQWPDPLTSQRSEDELVVLL